MLTELHVENFKAWRDLKIELGKVTALFGENSSGKSSLLQFLLMLKQTKNATDRSLVLDFGGPSDLVDLGSYETTVHRSASTVETLPEMHWGLTWHLPRELKIFDPLASPRELLFAGHQLRLEAGVGLEVTRRRRLAARRLAYHFDGTSFELRQREIGGRFELTSHGDKGFEFVRGRGRPPHRFDPVKTHLFPGAARYLFQNADLLSEFESSYEDLMDRIYYLGPLREHPQRDYRWTGSAREGVGDSGQFTIDAILAATDRGVTQNIRKYGSYMTFQELIAHWLRELCLIESFQVEEVAKGTGRYQVLVRRHRNGPQATLTDVGFGVSQVLPVLVLLYYVPQGSIVLMEQPELHLHPSVQSDLADVMLAVASHRNVQIVVESHSEHLLRRLQRRVAEEKASPSDLRLHFVRSQGGAAVLESLRLNEWGLIENWPENFFGDEMGEIAATSRAGLERRRQTNG